MNELKIFENPAFGKVRVVEQGGEPWFIGKDICEALGYTNSRKALGDHVKENHKNTVTIRDGIGNPNKTVIDEAGVYTLVMRSKLPQAEEFQEWVTAEVLPAIRKTGGYIAGSEKMSDAELMAKAVLVAQATIKERDARIAELESDTQRMKPKEIFADAVSASDQTILIGDLAKLIKQNGHDMGQKRMFEWLRNNGYLIKRQGADYNSPTQRAMELGLFRIKETAVTHSDGHVTVSKTVKVTGKGQAYFVNKLLGAKGA